jgi:metal transporter CNNM
MTPIKDVFMLSIDSKLDYQTLRKICATGHSRVPVYEEVEVPTSGVIEARNKAGSSIAAPPNTDGSGKTMIVKRVVGILLVKQVGDPVTRSSRRFPDRPTFSVFFSIQAVRLLLGT